jgi:hypothetical protein
MAKNKGTKAQPIHLLFEIEILFIGKIKTLGKVLWRVKKRLSVFKEGGIRQKPLKPD